VRNNYKTASSIQQTDIIVIPSAKVEEKKL